MEFLKNAFSALPHVATSPLAFVAYVLVVGAWLVITLKVKRNKQLLEHLDKIPEKSRLEALRMEMGAVRLKSGLTPEQWIKSRIHLYYFLGFAILCLVAVLIFVIAMTTKEKPGEARSDITVFSDESVAPANGEAAGQQADSREPTEFKVINAYDGSGARKRESELGEFIDLKPAPELTLKYSYERVENLVWIKPDMPYLSLLAEGGPITNEFDKMSFLWQFPKLSIKVVNNTNHTVSLSEAAIEVVKSTINREPVLMIPYGMALVFSNEGWGDVHNPQVRYGVTGVKACKNLDVNRQATRYTATLPTFSNDSEAIKFDYESFHKLVDDDSGDVCVYGEIKYTTDDGSARAVKFKAQVILGGLGGPGDIEPLYFYDVSLRAGKAGYTQRVPLNRAHVIKPGEVDHFIIRVATDKSAQFDLKFSFRDVGGTEIPTDHVRLDIFVPRSEKHLIAKKPSARGASFVPKKPTG